MNITRAGTQQQLKAAERETAAAETAAAEPAAQYLDLLDHSSLEIFTI